MGVDYHANALIGCRITQPQIIQTVRCCSHPEKSSNFCPECGKPMWKQEWVRHPLLVEDDRSETGFHLVKIRDEFYVGVLRAESESNRGGGGAQKISLENFDVNKAKQDLEKFLGKLYSEKEFGLWAVLYAG